MFLVKSTQQRPMLAISLGLVFGCLLTLSAQACGQALTPRGLPPYGVPNYGYGYRPGYYLDSNPLMEPLDPRYLFPGKQLPRSVLVQSQIVAAPPLPPATLLLTHRRQETLSVEVYDRKNGQSVLRGQIPAGQSLEVTLPRDAGGHVQETYQIIGAFGEPSQHEVTRALPVDIRYDVVVYRWHVQSVAIDRTGKSPSVIEDIQGQSKALGRFSLPPGRRLIDGQIDVYRNAIGVGNQRLTLPITPATDNDGPARDPLGQAIEELDQR